MRSRAVYVAPALVVWAGVYAAGVHPTIAGVLVGLITPVRAWLGTEGFLASVRGADGAGLGPRGSPRQPRGLQQPPAGGSGAPGGPVARRGLIEALHPWVAFGIMPIFALANAGVALGGVHFDEASWLVVTGVGVGLMAGKPVGLLLACGLVLRLGVARLPAGLGTRHLLVLGVVAGVGFTMALFIAQLAFTEATLLGAGKLGVLIASGGAAALALVLGRLLLPSAPVDGAARTADEAEDSTVA
ncbi:MAG: Na+/H+ antiporter NhaA [bacterium]